jgi:hypothetical protein
MQVLPALAQCQRITFSILRRTKTRSRLVIWVVVTINSLSRNDIGSDAGGALLGACRNAEATVPTVPVRMWSKDRDGPDHGCRDRLASGSRRAAPCELT